ncbi:ABC transporter permease [Yersinia mollaretii]|uniref:ABC transporter permease n=1 Tax=Yersinia mollaretii TaxID=33060 RepID=A0AA44I194_YERMO|nr:ABC transporter permease [Yersinia mollaretii]CNK98087.1 putative iron transport permease [Yersinia enterocolitica]NIL24271.1 ABC transporter permease [Yersinia mollaretii]CNJ21802.1 putative iron transport permease [Yersinia mollaretii]CNL00460.1 putative iron transport permease [Yersinia mollaretii]CQR09272.1 putative iron transport permease [Yersinia mollaretii]
MKNLSFIAGLVILLGLMMCSLFIGAGHVTFTDVWSDPDMRDIFLLSRVPRTLALVLAGSAMSVAGLIMQMLTQNRFVEPSIAGTTQSASLGLLLVMVFSPSAPVIVKMLVATLFAMGGTALFMMLLARMRMKSALMVPLTGIMLGAVFSAVTTFLAMEFDLLQSLGSWESGDFSGVLQGRYELLWIVGALTLISCLIADRFTVAGMGRDFSVNVGLNYQRVMMIGMSIIAITSGVVVVVIGVLPFLGLIVPNIVSMAMGDNLRRTIPWVALCGGGLVVLCDIIGRLISYPFEIPASVILGAIGALVFLLLIVRTKRHAG